MDIPCSIELRCKGTAAKFHKRFIHMNISLSQISSVSSLLEYAAMAKDRTFKNGQLPKTLRRMAAQLTNHVFQISGRNPYKEEFVTCGGVALTELHPATLECKRHPGLYFAGEVADVDAITGGFNLQAAWTMGYVAAKAIGGKEIIAVR